MKTHVSLNVQDVNASVEFYKRMFGTEPSKIRKGYAKFDLSQPPLNLALNESKVSRGGNLSHLGLQVESSAEVLSVGQRWQENGLLTRDEMQTNCCFALQDKTWVTDPDGNSWEVFAVLADTEPDAQNSISSCCISPPQIVSIAQSK